MDLWDEATRDLEAERHTARMAAGLAALADYRAIALSAVSEDDLDNRLSLMGKAFDKAAAVAVPEGGVDAAVIRTALHDAVATEWLARKANDEYGADDPVIAGEGTEDEYEMPVPPVEARRAEAYSMGDGWELPGGLWFSQVRRGFSQIVGEPLDDYFSEDEVVAEFRDHVSGQSPQGVLAALLSRMVGQPVPEKEVVEVLYQWSSRAPEEPSWWTSLHDGNLLSHVSQRKDGPSGRSGRR